MQAFDEILIFGDAGGVRELLSFIPPEKIVAIVGSGIRPQYFEELSSLARDIAKPFLIQPPRSNTNDRLIFLKTLEAIEPASLISNSYSLLIGEDILDKFQGRTANIHYSLLPKNRGPNPIQWSLINGETMTGVTLHHMNNRFDAGDIISQVECDIGVEDTWVSLGKKLKSLSLKMMEQQIPSLLTGTYAGFPQKEDDASQNPRLTPNSPKIEFDRMDDIQVYNLIRAQVEPLGGAFLETISGRKHFRKALTMPEVKELRRSWLTNESLSSL